MKRFISIILAVMTLFLMSSCGAKEETEITPEFNQMKAICELSTLECYYHNVAKFKQEDAKKFLWWGKDVRFWIEYEGIVKIGVDASLVNIEVKENNTVKITIPQAKVFGCTVNSATLNEDSFIVDANSAKITAEQETAAMAAAEAKMLESAKENKTLLASAQIRAKELLEDYVMNIGNCLGKEYKIEWVEVDEDGNAINNTSENNSENTSTVK